MTWEHAEETARPVLKCPLCTGTEFERQQGRMDSRWGITSHKLVLQICRNCGLVLKFAAGRGLFDFDGARIERGRIGPASVGEP